MKNRGRVIFFFVLIVIIGLAGFRLVERINQNKVEVVSTAQIPEEKGVPIQIAPVQRGEINSFLKITGLVEPKETVKVTAKIMGQVKEVLVTEGHKVKAGDILIRLDAEPIQLQVAQAQAAYEAALASLEKVKAGPRPEQIKQAEAVMQQAKINRDNAEQNYQRMEKLFSEGAISAQQHDQAKWQYETAEAQYQSAKASYELVKKGASPEDIKVVEAQVRQAQAALKIAETQLDNTIIRAPISGKVTSISVSPGEMVSAAIPLLVILDTSELYVRAGIAESDIASVQIGQQAEILIDAFPQKKFKGEIVTKGAAIDPTTKSVEIKIKIIEPEVEVPPGVFARVNILVKNNPEALIIPVTALTRKGDQLYVFVFNQGKGVVEKRAVVTGVTEGDRAEILEGVQEGEEIVVMGNLTLEDGDQVRVINREVTP